MQLTPAMKAVERKAGRGPANSQARLFAPSTPFQKAPRRLLMQSSWKPSSPGWWQEGAKGPLLTHRADSSLVQGF